MNYPPKIDGFELLELIGQSSTNQVFRALDQSDYKMVAIKVPMQECGYPIALHRYHREVEISNLLANDHRVKSYRTGRSNEGQPYLCMQLVGGKSIAALLTSDIDLLQRELIKILIQVCEYLAELHALGWVHGDIKPSNLLVEQLASPELLVKVSDLGVCRRIGEHEPTLDCRDGIVTGSPSFMAPELLTSPSRCNPSSDIYALGCTAYQLVSGSLPFAGNNALQILSKHRSQIPNPLQSDRLTAETCQLIMSCLAKQPSDRPDSATALAIQLRSLST